MSCHRPTPQLLCHLSPWQHHSWPQLLAMWFSMSLLQSTRWQVHTRHCRLMIRTEGTTLIMQKQFKRASDSTLVCFRSVIWHQMHQNEEHPCTLLFYRFVIFPVVIIIMLRGIVLEL